MEEHTTRKPMLLLRLSGLFLLRTEARALSGLLFQEPPRNTPVTLSEHPAGIPARTVYKKFRGAA